MPWKILEVEHSDNITERDVKKAYAKKLKLTRPDRDPEGFKSLREAYEKALYIIHNKELEDQYSDENNDHYDYPIDTNYEAEDLEKISQEHPEASLIIDAIHLDLKAGNLESAQVNLNKSEEYIYVHPGAIDVWSQKISSILHNSDFQKLEFNDELLCYVISSDNDLIADSCITHWYDSLNFTRLCQLAQYIVNNPSNLSNSDAGFFCERLACMIAIYDASIAHRLTVVSSKLLETQSYFGDFASESRITLGVIFSDLPKADRLFWHRVIGDDVSEEEWNAIDINQKFNTLNTMGHITVETLPIIRSFVPSQHKLNVRMLFREDTLPTTVSTSSSTYKPHPQYAQKSRKKELLLTKEPTNYWPLWALLFIIFKIVVFNSKSCSNDSSQGVDYYRYDDMENPIRFSGDELQDSSGRLRERLKELRLEHSNPSEPTFSPAEPERPKTFDLNTHIE